MIQKMTDKTYFARPELNQSKIKDILSMSPFEFKYFLENPKKPTSNMVLGSIVHCLCLEPDEFDNRYATFAFDYSKTDKVYKNLKNTTIYKEQYRNFLIENEGKEIIENDVLLQAEAMALKLDETGYISNKEALKEYAVFQRAFGSDCKAKLDYTDVEGSLLIDLKTTSDPLDDDSIMRTIMKWGFDIQSAFYLDLLKKEYNKDFTMVFLMVKNTPPYDVRPILIDPDTDYEFLQIGRDKINIGAKKLRKCYVSGVWEDNSKKPFFIKDIPFWYKKNAQNMIESELDNE